ncbi:MAG: hypothetical protein LBK61_01410 [Spirochaetaceae bacterium]|jgi:hypothetical protein|nr:hypothetical protein [Spirochaetaceae bacterium]
MVKCTKCGKEVKYIPVSCMKSDAGTVAVEPEYTGVITDGGREVKGHVRHICSKDSKEEIVGRFILLAETLHDFGYSEKEIVKIIAETDGPRLQ